ncbi:unnamed protein product [Spirodela intermedia]|uniref:PH domain-containing protein n=1 Tax=Spirodela intermedia TaxID=51605 RepID=A0A7I8JHY0_SPIIN|nr:unnamed protein product [Spirodela intermedia]CAA6669756.1 unnamed protein product [Spirodela intermedia]
MKGDYTYLADLSCDNLDCAVKIYSEAKIFNVKLGSYKLSSPNGLLAESATVADSLVGVFSYRPFESELDWSFVAKASPCYMTYLKDSVDNIISFFKNSTAISQTLALETAAAVQMTLDGVKRTAQQQFTRALRDHARFFLDLDIAAPKITIPHEFYPENTCTKLLLDLGHLKLSTEDENEFSSTEREDLNFQFNVVLNDVSAFMVDGEYSWSPAPEMPSSSTELNSVLPVIDKCGVLLKLQQIQLENPLYQRTKLAIHLPVLGFHFSPARYHRLMKVLKLFQDDHTDAEDMIRPWGQADFGGWLSVLSWKGVGNREAVWQRRYLCIAGQFLYVLENPTSKTYKQYFSLRGKQVHQIPLEFLGDEEHVLALSDASQLSTKVVEDASAIILHCDSDDSCKTWQNRIQGAIYRASGPAAVSGLSDASTPGILKQKQMEEEMGNLFDMERLFITGVLDELKIRFSCNYNTNQNFKVIMLGKESGLLEFRATGGQVEVSIRENDLFIGTLLKSLEIEDLFHCEGVPKPRYLARSFIKDTDDSAWNLSPFFTTVGDQNSVSSEQNETDTEEKFFEASDDLSDFIEATIQPQGVIPEFLSSRSYFPPENSSMNAPSFNRIPGLLPDAKSYDKSNFKEAATLDNFVKAQIIIFDRDSSLYTSIDKQHRIIIVFLPSSTILAVLEFVNAVSAKDDQAVPQYPASAFEINSSNTVPSPSNSDLPQEPVVKGLLGRGKSRAIFYLMLNMARAQIFLMNENGKCLATLLQNNLLIDIKVFPSSFQIKAALGNLKISDDSLPLEHSYFWVCDMRNPDGSSFVELDFNSFSVDDEDYPGYDYSLIGELSEVRIVYLNRFVQELLYGPCPTSSKGIVRLKDQVSDSEKWFTTTEIQGSPALKLDLSLSRPIILMPRRTDSPDYLQLDVLKIAVHNTFQWFGGDMNEMSAVRLEILTIKVKDINLTIGTGTLTGESIIQDVKGLSIIIQKSLRDLLHQIPLTEINIKVKELSASLSNREYEIVTECALSNISETPNCVPPLNIAFHTAAEDEGGSLVSLASDSAEGTIDGEAWTKFKIMVSISLVKLCLYSGIARDSCLATVQARGAWVLFKSDSIGQGFLSSTLTDFSVIDNREGTKQEFRLAIGKHESVTGFKESKEKEKNYAKSVPAMLILDVKFKQSSTIVSLCVQRPHLLVALDFLLAIVEFFVPTVQNMLSDERDKDHLRFINAIIPDQPIYSQPSSEFSLSPNKPLVVDCEKFDHLIFDGKGGNLCLEDRLGITLSNHSSEAMIFVGNGKRLQFRNVYVKNGKFLDSCIFLGTNSSYSACEDDNVFLGNDGEDAISPELTFYCTSGDLEDSQFFSTKLLHAQFDMFCRVALKDDSMELYGDVLGLKLESNGIRVLEPFDTRVKFSNVSGKTNIHASTSDIYMNFSFSSLKLFLTIQDDILEFMRMTTNKFSVVCSQFDKVGTIQTCQSEQTYAFWRARAPPGFAVLGDCLTPLNEPPSKGVTAVNTSFARVKKPVSFRLIWPCPEVDNVQEYKGEAKGNNTPTRSGSNTDKSRKESGCSLWFPVAPEGYVAVGCVVSTGRVKPSLSSTLCISSSFVSSCSLKDCISLHLLSTSIALWRVDNSFGSFLPTEPNNMSLIGKGYDLRHLCFGYPEFQSKPSMGSDVQPDFQLSEQMVQLERSPLQASSQLFEPICSFRLIWWNQGAPSRKKLSIWRPVVPMAWLILVISLSKAPNTCVIPRDTGDSTLLKPACGFQLGGHINKEKGVISVSFWLPQAPLALFPWGALRLLRCIRHDLVTASAFPDESIWDSSDTERAAEPFSIWGVGNEACTFFARNGLKRPPKRFALRLADPSASSGADDTVIVVEMKTFSAAVYDDYAGLMVPLCNIGFSRIGFNLCGKPGFVNSTLSFALAARSYNDKIDSWEPLVEPIDGVVQYDSHAPGAFPQLRIVTTRDLNLIVSVSNTNMILQAHSSWNSLNSFTGPKRAIISPTYEGRSVIDFRRRRNYFIIPQNKLGQDIYIRVTERKRFSDIIKMPSGDNKLVTVPVSKNLMDSHLQGKHSQISRCLVTIIVADAEFPYVEGITTGIYAVVVRKIHKNPNESSLQQPSVRTCGAMSEHISSGLALVEWNEVFFFKVDDVEQYMVDFTVIDMGKDEPVGSFSAPLKKAALKLHPNSRLRWPDNSFHWGELFSKKTTVSDLNKNLKSSGRIRFSVLLQERSEVVNHGKDTSSGSNGFIQISPTRYGPWTTVRLNYAAPAACWRLGNDVIASEVNILDGNRYVNIRSLVSVTNKTDFVIEFRLKTKASGEDLVTLDTRIQKDQDSRHSVIRETDELFETENYISSVGWVGSSSQMPFSDQPTQSDSSDLTEYAWSEVLSKYEHTESDGNKEFSEICVSKLNKSEELLYCMPTSGNSSDVVRNQKDIHSEPIHDWNLVVDSPLSLTNFLPLSAEYSVLNEESNGDFVTRHRDTFKPGETSKIYNVDLREALYLSLVPRGWEHIDVPALVSHPNRIPAKTISLRSSFSGRVVSVILEQSHEKAQLQSRLIRLYVPYWISKRRLFTFTSKQESEKVVLQITEEELHEGDTISAPLNFQRLGLCLSLGTPGREKFGPIKDLLPLSDMDGSVDLFAYDIDGNCTRVLISSKPCRYQAVPTKYNCIYFLSGIVRTPYMTFTNRVGQDIFIKFSAEDQQKVLHASDSRVSFIYSEMGEAEKLQVRMEDTNWSFPVEILKEDTITIMLKNCNGERNFLRLEIRGYEEGSRFLVVLRPGSARCPVRIENRIANMKINIRQSTLGDDAWVTIYPLSSINFAWEVPYGPNLIDICLQNGNNIIFQNISLENATECYADLRKEGFDFHFTECGDVRNVRIIDIKKDLTELLDEQPTNDSISNGNGPSFVEKMKTTAPPVELIIELGIVGISLVDHRPRELLYLSLEKVFVSYSSGYDGGTTSRFKLIVGQLQIDNQLPLTVMPVFFMPEYTADVGHPVFKATITVSNENIDGTQVYPYVYIRVTENYWRVNIHEPIIWALVDFYNNLQIDRVTNASNVTAVDPEIRINQIDVSEMRFKVSLETAPTQRPHGVLGVWSPILSTVGSAFKIQIRLRKVMHHNRFMRQSAIVPAIINRVKRDLIHNPLHLILSVDVLGMTKSTLASLSKGFAELSTDVQFLQLRSKQVWSRRITGVGDGIIQGTEALAQSVAFGFSGVIKKPVESAREHGVLGLPQGLLRAVLGVVVQPVSGALDFVSLTVDGIGASFTRCLEFLSNRSASERIRNPRAIRANGLLSEYSEREATGQMILYLAETSRHLGCTDLFKEPSKYAWSDFYEDHFLLPHQRILLITNKRIMLLLCLDPEKMDRRPCKIIWDVQWEELLALELAKAGCPKPSHLIIHLKNFRKSESFVRLVKCSFDIEDDQDPQAVRICSTIHKTWKAHQLDMKTLTLRVPSSQRYVQFAWDESTGGDSERRIKSAVKTRRLVSSSSFLDERRFVKHVVNFQKIWSSERDSQVRCILYPKQVADDAMVCTLWRPVCPDGYVPIGDIARAGIHPPTVAAVYRDSEGNFAEPLGYDLVWRNCAEDYVTPLSIWSPRPPEGFVSAGCVAVAGFEEPRPESVYCVSRSLSEEAPFEEQMAWAAPDSYPWSCYVYPVQSEALHFVALRQPREDSNWRPIRVSEPPEEAREPGSSRRAEKAEEKSSAESVHDFDGQINPLKTSH